MDLFDTDEYLDANGDVVKANVPASLHYLLFGHSEGREPSSRFSGTAYLAANRDVASVGHESVGPLRHQGATRGQAASPGRRGAKARSFAPCQLPWPAAAPLVSVVIPCFNYGRSLPRAVASVLAQTWEDLEVIVIEGGSTDPGSVAAVREFEAEGPSRTTFHYRDQRHFVGDNRNYGISRAQGRYIVCLDPDDELEPVYLEVALFLAEAFALRPRVPICPMLRRVRCHLARIGRVIPRHARANHIPTVALFRRSAWVEAGGFRDWGTGDSHVPEDWAFWTRLVGMGYRSKAIRQPLMRYHVHAGSLSASASSDLAAYRPAIRDASADLLEGASVLATEPDSGMAQNPYCNLLSRGPSEDDKGSVLIAMPYVTVGGAERLMASLAESLVDDGYRVIVVTSSELPENTPDGTSVLRASTGQVYELPGLFTDRAQQDAYLLFLIQRYRVDTLLIVGSRLVYELLPEIRRTVPGIGVVDQLFNAVGHTTSHSEFASLIDLAVVPSTELKTQLEDEWGTSAEVSVIPHAVHIDGIGLQDPGTVGRRRGWASHHRVLRSMVRGEGP